MTLQTHTPNDDGNPVATMASTANADAGGSQSETTQSNANSTVETTASIANADAGGPQLETDQSIAISPVETTAPPANAGGERPQSEAATSQVRRGEPQRVSPLKQATQLSDKARTVGRLAGGQSSPRPPEEPKKKDNKISFRADDEMQERIASFAADAGHTESEAMRVLVEIALGQPRVTVTPKAPPAHLEFFARQIKAWIKTLQPIRSRLNVPMPETDDEELTQLVKGWRAQSAQLLKELPELLECARAQRKLLTNLDGEKIADLRFLYPYLKHWIQTRTKKKESFPDASSTEAKENDKAIRNYRTIAKLIEDLGILKGGV